MAADERTAQVPIWRYTITLVQPSGQELLVSPITVDAMAYEEDGPWTVFDDTVGTVLSRRTDTILEVRRSADPVSHQGTDLL